jgi:microcin C transport system ATP-binding protein
MNDKSNLLSVNNLSVAFGQGDAASTVVKNVGFDLGHAEKLALVGESGSGKSVTALSIMQLHDPKQVQYQNGEIVFQGENMLRMPGMLLRKIRGAKIGMIFQEPMTSLNPVYTIGNQLIEPLTTHEGLSKQAAKKRMIELLDRTGIPEPQKRFDAYPHMLSGGQRQRVMIAMSLACNPSLLIADEPTTALDVSVQAQILELLEDIQAEFNMSILMITHDLNLVRRFADRVCVMRQGELVETAQVEDLFVNPQHEYTKHLLSSQPKRLISDNEHPAQSSEKLMTAEDVKCYFPIKQGVFRRQVGEVKAVDNVTLDLYSGETLGIVGESGSGKTTLGMCLLKLENSTGEISFDGKRLDILPESDVRKLRSDFQVVFQDPYSSLSPRMTVEQIISEGLKIHYPEFSAAQRRDKILSVLAEVGLEEEMLGRYPHEFSGGQRQRIAIARVVVLEPKLILLDEPTSALDVSVQKQVLSLLRSLQEKRNISYLFISHDLKVIRSISHRVMVMRSGQEIESGETETLFNEPKQEYTKMLLQASLYQ